MADPGEKEEDKQRSDQKELTSLNNSLLMVDQNKLNGVLPRIYNFTDYNQFSRPTDDLDISTGTPAPSGVSIPDPIVNKRIQLPDGDTTVTALSWAATGEQDSGFYRAGVDDYKYQVNGSTVTEWLTAEFRVNYLTTGSVVFAGASGKLSQDNSNLFWDDSNNRLGIGCNDPWKALEVRSSSSQLVLSLDDNNAVLFQGNGLALTITGYGTLYGEPIEMSWTGAPVAQSKSISVYHTDNTSGSSHARFIAQVGGASAGDAATFYSVAFGTTWGVGLDNSDSDKFKISKNATLGTNDCLTIDTGSAVFKGASEIVSITGDAANQNLELRYYDNALSALKGRLLYAGANGAGARYFGFINSGGDYLGFYSDTHIFGDVVASKNYISLTTSSVNLAPWTITGTSSSNRVRISAASSTTQTGNTTRDLRLDTSYSDGGTNSTTLVRSLEHAQTINYTGASKTGKVHLEYFGPTLTSLPTGTNAGIAFSSAFTNSSFPAIRFFNTADEDTNPEWAEMGWHASANLMILRTMNAGTGTARTFCLAYGGSANPAINIGTSTITLNNMTTSTATSFVSINPVSTATSGTVSHLAFSLTAQDGGTNSSTIQNILNLNPTINYSAATKTGKVRPLYVNPTNTSLPTGLNAAIALSSTASTLGGIMLFNTSDELTNVDYGTMAFTSNVLTFSTAKLGSGTIRNIGFTISDPVAQALVAFTSTSLITAGVTDGYNAGIRLSPTYNAATAQTVTRHNYIDLNDAVLGGAGPAALTDACVFRLDAALGTHKATTNTDRTGNAKSGTLKVNVAGTLYYIQLYA